MGRTRKRSNKKQINKQTNTTDSKENRQDLIDPWADIQKSLRHKLMGK